MTAGFDPGLTAQVVERSAPMSTRRDSRPDFEEFVVACSDRLLRTAYLLARDPALAEDLLQAALVKAWFGWNRLDGQPEPSVRTILVNDYATRWRRRRSVESTGDLSQTADVGGAQTGHGLWVALGHLPRPQRAAVVLRFFDDLSEADAADALGCTVRTVRSRTSKALARLPVDPARSRDAVWAEQLRTVLLDGAADLGGSDGVGVRARVDAVARRVDTAHARRRAGLAATAALAAVAVVGGVVAVPRLIPDAPQGPGNVIPHQQMVATPPRLAGHVVPERLVVKAVTYRYQRGEQTQEDTDLLRVAVPSSPARQAVGWSTSQATPGRAVVSVDGTEVSRSRAGVFEYGVLLVPNSAHLVVVRATRPTPGGRIGFALYERDPHQG